MNHNLKLNKFGHKHKCLMMFFTLQIVQLDLLGKNNSEIENIFKKSGKIVLNISKAYSKKKKPTSVVSFLRSVTRTRGLQWRVLLLWCHGETTTTKSSEKTHFVNFDQAQRRVIVPTPFEQIREICSSTARLTTRCRANTLHLGRIVFHNFTQLAAWSAYINTPS